MKYLLIVIAILWGAATGLAMQPMALEQCVDSALSHNQNLKSLDAKLESSELQVKNTQTAYLPRVDFGSYYQYVSEVAKLTAGPITESFGGHDSYSINGILSEMLFDGGQAHYRSKSAAKSLEAMNANRKNTAEDIAIGIARLYYGIQGVTTAKETFELEEKSLQDTRKDAQHRLEAGLILDVDLLAIDLQLATARNRIEDLETNLKSLKLQLLSLMGMSIEAELELAKDSSETNSIETQNVQFDPERRTNLIALNQQIEAGEYRVKSLGGTFLPMVNARAGYYYEKPGIDKLKNEWMDYWTAGINLSWSLWDFGNRSRDRRAAQFENKALHENLVFATEQAELQYKTAELNLSSATRQIELSKKQVDLAEKKLNWTRDRYGSEVATSTDLIAAVNEWESAKLTQAKNLIDFRLNQMELKYATGDILK